MQTIKSKNELPEWFKSKEYSKKLSATDWYREISKRNSIIHLLDLHEGRCESLENSRPALIDILLSEPNKTSPIYYIQQHSKPIQPLSVFEVLYLNAAIEVNDSDMLNEKIQNIVKMWRIEIKRKDNLLYSYEYERELEDFFKIIYDREMPFLDVLSVSELGNPFLSYGRPLSGTPVTIDTQFDDQTIIESVKRWLETQRAELNEKARRPFNQNDFDDWAYFKIREVSDLDIWAKITGIKILDKVIANVLWPYSDGDISPIDILRTTTRKKVREIFNYQTAVRFYGQLLIQEGENFLEK